MESLNLQTGYKGVMEKRQDRLNALADKYSQETAIFEEEEKKIREEVAEQAIGRPDWLKDSIRESVA